MSTSVWPCSRARSDNQGKCLPTLLVTLVILPVLTIVSTSLAGMTTWRDCQHTGAMNISTTIGVSENATVLPTVANPSPDQSKRKKIKLLHIRSSYPVVVAICIIGVLIIVVIVLASILATKGGSAADASQGKDRNITTATTTIIPTPSDIPGMDTTATTTFIPTPSDIPGLDTTATTTFIPTPSDIPESDCGRSQLYPVPRIIGGIDTKRGQYPWVVLLLSGGAPLCGGTIWDYDHILTAAHCINTTFVDKGTGRINTSSLDIIAGKFEFNLSTNHYEQKVHVASGLVHTEYNETSYHNDIALLKLAQSLKPTQLVMKICVPRPTDPLPQKGTVAGWGTTSTDTNHPVYPSVLQYVEVNVYSFTDCEKFYSRSFSGMLGLSFYLSNGTVCAANAQQGGKDSCQGDSGGPLFWNEGTGGNDHYTIIGIVSQGYRCARPGEPGIYTLVPFYLDWISNVTALL